MNLSLRRLPSVAMKLGTDLLSMRQHFKKIMSSGWAAQ